MLDLRKQRRHRNLIPVRRLHPPLTTTGTTRCCLRPQTTISKFQSRMRTTTQHQPPFSVASCMDPTFPSHACAPPSSRPSLVFPDRSRRARRPGATRVAGRIQSGAFSVGGEGVCGGASLVRGEEAGTCFLYTALCAWSRRPEGNTRPDGCRAYWSTCRPRSVVWILKPCSFPYAS
jgi:hypothetical protein